MQIQVIQAKKKTPVKRRVCVYARVSSNSAEQESSYYQQVTFLTEYIRNQPNWELTEVYADQGISGYKDKRPEFQRMLTDARAGKFDLVVVKSISRFARNTETVLKATRDLKARGIGVIFHLQNINTLESTGELFITIMSAFAQGESDNCRTRMQYAYRSKYEQGIATTSAKYTYGFQPGPDGNIAIVEKEAEVVRMIFDWAAQGVWIARIRATLNRKHIPSPSGGQWDDTGVKRTLHNVMYKGDIWLRKRYINDDRKRCVNRGEVDCWYITNNHPAIVSPEKFDRVQYILEERWDKLNTPKEPFNGELGNSHNRYPLSGKLFCPYCGALLIHKWGKHRTREYWACSTNLKKSKAACKGIFLPASETVGWDIDEPVVALSYKDDFGRKRYTAFPFDEYEMMKTEGMNT